MITSPWFCLFCIYSYKDILYASHNSTLSLIKTYSTQGIIQRSDFVSTQNGFTFLSGKRHCFLCNFKNVPKLIWRTLKWILKCLKFALLRYLGLSMLKRWNKEKVTDRRRESQFEISLYFFLIKKWLWKKFCKFVKERN